MRSWHFIFILLLCCGAAIAAEDPKQFFETVYGNRLRQVKATANMADDVALGKQILAAAQTIEDVHVLALMCDQVIELTQRQNEGLPVAIDAARFLAERVEARRDGARKKLAELFTRQSQSNDAAIRQQAGDALVDLLVVQADEAAQAGKIDDAIELYRQAQTAAQRNKSFELDAIRLKADALSQRVRVEKQIARLEEKLLANANDYATAEEIIRSYVVDMDNAAEAMKWIDRAKSPKITRMIPLAAKPLADTAEADALLLGEWYSELAAAATGPAKHAMFGRTATYLRHYLACGPASGLAKTKGELLLKEAEAAMESIELEQGVLVLRNIKRTEPATWISKGATYKISTDVGYAIMPDLLTGGANLAQGQFAMHTGNGPGEFVVIDLGKPMVMTRVWIENRRTDSQNAAKGMVLLLMMKPTDKPRPVWTAEQVAAEWTVDLPQPMKARYIKLKLPDTGKKPLHLAQVKVYGWEK